MRRIIIRRIEGIFLERTLMSPSSGEIYIKVKPIII